MRIGSILLAFAIASLLCDAKGGKRKAKTRSRQSKKIDPQERMLLPDEDRKGGPRDGEGFNTQDLLDVVDPSEFIIPSSCSEQELTTIMKRCLTIWKGYCKCAHCLTTCDKDEWPPAETAAWDTYRKNIGWEELAYAWKWSGKCAYNATHVWRTLCNDNGNIARKDSPAKSIYEYWFLVGLNDHDALSIRSLCETHECHKWKQETATGTEPPVEHTEFNAITVHRPQTPIITTEGRQDRTHTEIYSKHAQELLDALDPSDNHIPVACSDEQLSKILDRCTIIWEAYCKCARCSQTCQENDWPPPATKNWNTAGRVVGWEKLDEAWKWAAKCAHNATYLWRLWCGNDGRTSNGSEFVNTDNDWFLTSLRMDSHVKMVNALCEQYECTKWKETDIRPQADHTYATTESTTSKDVIVNARKSTTDSVWQDSSTTAQYETDSAVPQWAIVLITALGTLVILLFVSILFFFYSRKRQPSSLKERQFALQGHAQGRRETTTDTSTSWQPQTSFTFLGKNSLPGVDDSLYHTIGETPLPVSQTLALGSFAPTAEINGSNPRASSSSVRNVLYHATVPFGRQITSIGPGEPHTYEEAVPRFFEKSNDAELPAPPPLSAPPYFVPLRVGHTEDEYGSLSASATSTMNEDGSPRFAVRDTQPEVETSVGNYDHIQLL